MTQQNYSPCAPKYARHLLVVDDEENVSRSLVRLLRQDNYKIFTASCGKQGLEILAANDIGVIVSDQRMPEMSGTEFLSQVSQSYPDTIRIVLSGYTELKSVTEAINEGKIYKFLTKPWDDSLLRQNIRDAFSQYEMLAENRRLSNELSEANIELKKLNNKLANNLKTESRISQISLRSLQVAQDILQNIPIGILGFDEEKTIVFANGMAHEIFSGVQAYLLGNNIEKLMPLFNFDITDKLISLNNYEIINGNRTIDVNIKLFKHRILSESSAFIIAIFPIKGI